MTFTEKSLRALPPIEPRIERAALEPLPEPDGYLADTLSEVSHERA